MRKTFRGLLWVIRGTLLAIALAMVGIWGLSHVRHGFTAVHRFTVESERVEFLGFDAAWWDGRIAIGRWRERFTGESLSTGGVIAARHIAGWQWELESGRPWWADGNWPASGGANIPPKAWGVVRWQSYELGESGYRTDAGYSSAPCWLPALLTGAWPAVSLTLLIRRRARRRRLARAGCCVHCGYDLRATPAAGGALLERCPECATSNPGRNAANARGNRKSDMEPTKLNVSPAAPTAATMLMALEQERRMEPDVITSREPPANPKAAAEGSAPLVHYAQPRPFARLRRWLRPGSPVFCVLVLALAAGGTWGAWNLRLKADERAFDARVAIYARNQIVEFSKPPDAASLRHLGRLPGTWTLYFTWPGSPDPSAPLALRGRMLANVGGIVVLNGTSVDAWLKELSRPDAGLAALTLLELSNSPVTDAGLKDLSRPDCNLKALTTLNLFNTQVTDTGLSELARPGSGLKCLATLQLQRTAVTDAGLHELTRPDSGLKELAELYLNETKVTDAGVAALKRARPGLKVYR